MIVAFMLCEVMVSGRISNAFAGDVMIIANKEVPAEHLGWEEVNGIFLGKIMRWSNDDRIIIVLHSNDDIHEAFLKKYVKRTATQFSNVWRQNMFTGKGRIPVEKNSDAELIDYVSKTKGAISYISSDVTLPPGIKVLAK